MFNRFKIEINRGTIYIFGLSELGLPDPTFLSFSIGKQKSPRNEPFRRSATALEFQKADFI